MGTIVVGVDGSEGSRAALRGCPMVAVTVWQYPVLTTLPAFGALPPIEDLSQEADTSLRQVLADEGVDLGGDVDVRTVVAEGAAAAALLEAATDADLLVVGSRGHGGFTGMLLGSVSQHVVSHAPCPVVVVRG
jgi:nucleotide-binding universal stress UspA family protein